MLRKFAVPLSVVIANSAALLSQVLLPRFLEVDEYSLFSVGWASGIFIATLVFEWARYGVLRYACIGDEGITYSRRCCLFRAYEWGAGLLLFFAAACAIGGYWFSPFFFIASVLVYAAMQGGFEGGQAWLRANEQSFTYGSTAIIRALLSLVLLFALVSLMPKAWVALIGMASAFPLAILTVRKWSGIRGGEYSPVELRFLIRFGFWAACGSIASSLFPTLYRSLIVVYLGLSQAAGAILISDLSIKILGVVGLALNILLMQKMFSMADRNRGNISAEQLMPQFYLQLAAIAPVVVIFVLLQPVVMPLLAPEKYVDSYQQALNWSVGTAFLLIIRQYALDPMFLAIEKSRLALLGPLVTLLAIPIGGELMRLVGGVDLLVWVRLVFFAALLGLCFSVALLFRSKCFRIGVADLLPVLLGVFVIVFSFEGFAFFEKSFFSMVFSATVGCIGYCAVLFFLDFQGLRCFFKKR